MISQLSANGLGRGGAIEAESEWLVIGQLIDSWWHPNLTATHKICQMR